MRLQNWLESLRKWIDGEEDLDEKGQPKPRSKWDDFLVSIARDIEQCMQREMFTPPGGPTYIPREYVVFLNKEDDAQWQGEKREGLERGLHHVLSLRAKELAGESEFQTKTLTIELRVDAALEPGKFRVQHIWDAEAEKTRVQPRKKATPVQEPEEDATVVRPRKSSPPVFALSLRHNSAESVVDTPVIHSFHKSEISIGRGSRQVEVDLKLSGDMEVSRKHATLSKKDDTVFVITCHGANPVVLGDRRELPSGESAEVRPGEKIAICSYELVIQ